MLIYSALYFSIQYVYMQLNLQHIAYDVVGALDSNMYNQLKNRNGSYTIAPLVVSNPLISQFVLFFCVYKNRIIYQRTRYNLFIQPQAQIYKDIFPYYLLPSPLHRHSESTPVGIGAGPKHLFEEGIMQGWGL